MAHGENKFDTPVVQSICQWGREKEGERARKRAREEEKGKKGGGERDKEGRSQPRGWGWGWGWEMELERGWGAQVRRKIPEEVGYAKEVKGPQDL